MPKDKVSSKDTKVNDLAEWLTRIAVSKAQANQLDEDEKIAKEQEEKIRVEMRHQSNEAKKLASESEKNRVNITKISKVAETNKKVIDNGLCDQLSEAIDNKIDYLPKKDDELVRRALYRYCKQYVYTVVCLNTSGRDDFKHDFWQYATKYFGENGFWASAGSIFCNVWTVYRGKRIYFSPKLKYHVKFDASDRARPDPTIIDDLGKGFISAYMGFIKEYNITLLKLPELPPDDDAVSTTEQATATSTQVSDDEVVDSSSEKTSATSNRAL